MARDGADGRRSGRTPRVGVFIDGQNITIGARYAFGGTGNMHPLLLGRALAGAGELVEIRYATGIPDHAIDPERAEAAMRRHDLIRRTDVVMLERTLRYRWEWQVRDRDLPDPRHHKGEVRKARVKSYNRGQEKGIDVWLALDALAMCARADIDRVILATADRDLDMVPRYVKTIPGQEATTVVAAKVLGDGKPFHHNDAYDDTVAIDRLIYDACRDDFDYSQPLDGALTDGFIDRIGSGHDGIRD
ncbi:MAG: NYN domain-containing protein [Acidimicrobiales bacterium]